MADGSSDGSHCDHPAELIRAQLGQISDLMASPVNGSDAVLWATARALEAADQLL